MIRRLPCCFDILLLLPIQYIFLLMLARTLGEERHYALAGGAPANGKISSRL
jgi:hypothetical protein